MNVHDFCYRWPVKVWSDKANRGERERGMLIKNADIVARGTLRMFFYAETCLDFRLS